MNKGTTFLPLKPNYTVKEPLNPWGVYSFIFKFWEGPLLCPEFNNRVDYWKSPFSLRENETRAHVKISPREERRDTAVESVEWVSRAVAFRSLWYT